MIHILNQRFLTSLFFCLSLFSSGQLQGQRIVSNQRHLWFAITGNHQISNSWYIWTDFQVRQSEFGMSKQQLIARSAIDYKFNSQLTAGLGYAFVKNWPYGEQPIIAKNMENRIYSQVQLKQNIGTSELQHRYRLEHRILPQSTSFDTVSKKYTETILVHRIRYRFQLTVPIGKQTEGKGFMAGFNNEVFLGLGKQLSSKNLLDQNRLYVFTGYKFSANSQINIGYMNQWINKSDGIKAENNHTVLLMYSHNLNLIKKTKQS